VAKSSFDCKNQSNTITVMVWELPLKPQITRIGNTISTSSGDQLKWYRNGVLLSDTTKDITDAISGVYLLEITDINGCRNISDTFRFTNTSVRNSIVESSFYIRPNPANEIVYVGTFADESFSMELSDISGKVIYSADDLKGEQQIALDALSRGLYIVTIEGTQSGVYRKKLVLGGN
jgi:hypothetical protein